MTLIERLEAASGAAFAFDAAIARACGYTSWPPPAYTASVDAALTLVPEGYGWKVRRWASGCSAAAGCYPPEGSDDWHKAATPALALCIASLRARGL